MRASHTEEGSAYFLTVTATKAGATLAWRAGPSSAISRVSCLSVPIGQSSLPQAWRAHQSLACS